jgi:poly(beta-D-mannuronate) lyase
MKHLISILLLTFYFSLVSARRVEVTSASAINSGSWSAGDTIVLKNGTWTNQTISLRAFGTASQPIVLEAETPGQVIFNGSSRVSISGQYVEVSGIYFKDGTLSGSPVVEFRTSSSNVAENCRLTNCAIVNYNPALNTVDSKWVSLYGRNNRVDHCSFENKNNSGTLLVVWLTAGIIPAHIIENNYFGYRNPNLDSNGNELNGQEIIRIGDSATSMQYANCIVRNNFFEKCNGEIEIISNKSCGNLYSNNVFYECKGMLTLRHGNDCTVEGNYFFGNGISNTGGVRIIGEDHKVYNNYFQDLRGTNFRAALCVVRGMLNSVLNDYFQVKNAQVMFNTFVNCTQSFCINYNSSTSYTMPPIGTVVAHNHVFNTNANNTNVLLAQNHADLNITWKNNLMNAGRYTSFTYNNTQIITGQNALMMQVAAPIAMMEPGAESALQQYKTTDFENITNDIRGRQRAAEKIPGASEINGIVSRTMPASTNTGATFLNNITTVNTPAFRMFPLWMSVTQGNVRIRGDRPGVLQLIDCRGLILKEKQVGNQEYFEKNLTAGAYILRFIATDGDVFTRKFLI